MFSGIVNRTVATSDPAEAPAKAFTTFSNFLPCLQRADAAPKWYIPRNPQAANDRLRCFIFAVETKFCYQEMDQFNALTHLFFAI